MTLRQQACPRSSQLTSPESEGTAAQDEVGYRTELTNCSTVHVCNANSACGWEHFRNWWQGIDIRHASPLFCDALLLCPYTGPLAITAAQFSE